MDPSDHRPGRHQPAGAHTPDLSRVAVVLPALNEADALPVALASWPPAAELVVVDNGSTDQTAAVAAALGARVVHEPRRGFGAACLAGVLACPAAEVVAFADADGSFDGADLAAVAGPVLAGTADLVLGSRLAGTRTPGAMGHLAAFENRLLAGLCRALFGVRLSDLGPFRAVRRDTLLALGVRDRAQGWPLEMVARAARAGLRIVEVPVGYRPRAGGVSKVSGSLPGTLRAVWDMTAVLARVLLRLPGVGAAHAASPADGNGETPGPPSAVPRAGQQQ
jgi:glycosyltransferase involved in cell wall biosynthesis